MIDAHVSPSLFKHLHAAKLRITLHLLFFVSDDLWMFRVCVVLLLFHFFDIERRRKKVEERLNETKEGYCIETRLVRLRVKKAMASKSSKVREALLIRCP